MKGRLYTAVITALLVSGLAGCRQLPGKPSEHSEELLRPEEVKDFSKLYASNCAACHGETGRGGPAIALANPEFQALVDNTTLHNTIRDGVAGHLMPAFGSKSGGMLTDEQIDVLVSGMRERWNTATADHAMPPHAATLTGDATHGEAAYQARCASCHSSSGEKATTSILAPAYLDLVSDQALRDTIIAGRPDLGHPDWKATPGHPMTDQEVTDIVAWMASKRDLPSTAKSSPSSQGQQGEHAEHE